MGSVSRRLCHLAGGKARRCGKAAPPLVPPCEGMVKRCGLGEVDGVPEEREKGGKGGRKEVYPILVMIQVPVERKEEGEGKGGNGGNGGRVEERTGRRGRSAHSANISGLSIKNAIPVSMVFPPHFKLQGPCNISMSLRIIGLATEKTLNTAVGFFFFVPP